ncbi:MAG TPA: GNAT family N-acetyltransferase [Chloroflexia bacterium]|nr:GNAT family N-acetyltransferase [Chloroflexia bacterium]
MTAGSKHGLLGRQELSEEEAGDARLLADICNAYEGLDLKLGLGVAPGGGQETNRFLYYEGGALVGFCSLDYKELCGMVHPEHRRRGIGRALLAAAIDEYRRRSVTNFLIIREEASQSGKGFVAATMSAEYDFSEHHMELEPEAGWGESVKQDDRLDSFRAAPGDVDTLAHLTALALDRPEEETRRHLLEDIKDPTQSFYIARLEGMPIATLKAFALGEKIGIYAFGVLLEYRGRGLGKQFFTQTIKRLMSEGWTRFALEVETTNTNAIGLYRSCGFKVTTTYGYYRVEI